VPSTSSLPSSRGLADSRAASGPAFSGYPPTQWTWANLYRTLDGHGAKKLPAPESRVQHLNAVIEQAPVVTPTQLCRCREFKHRKLGQNQKLFALAYQHWPGEAFCQALIGAADHHSNTRARLPPVRMRAAGPRGRNARWNCRLRLVRACRAGSPNHDGCTRPGPNTFDAAQLDGCGLGMAQAQTGKAEAKELVAG